MKYLLIVLSILFINCASLVNYYDVYIDSKFSDEERIKIEQSLSNWEIATHNNVNFNIHSLNEYDGRNHAIKIHYYSMTEMETQMNCPDAPVGEVKGGCTERNKLTDSSDIGLPMDSSLSIFALKTIAMHEIGHALGLKHSSAGQIMSPSVGSSSRNITCDDVYSYYELRNINELCYD